MLVYVCVSDMCARGVGEGSQEVNVLEKNLCEPQMQEQCLLLFCVSFLEDGFTEEVTLLSLFVHKPSPLLLEFN